MGPPGLEGPKGDTGTPGPQGKSPGRKDLRATRARSELRDPLVLRGFQVRREIPDMLGWPACRAQRAMPAREARQGHEDQRGI